MQCAVCKEEKALTDFFTYKTLSGRRPFKKCKSCHNPPKKGTGWCKVDPVKQQEIIELIHRRETEGTTYREIERLTGVSQVNIRRWHLAGLIKA